MTLHKSDERDAEMTWDPMADEVYQDWVKRGCNPHEADERDDEFNQIGRPATVYRLIKHVSRMLPRLDPEPKRPGLDDTPERVAHMYHNELCSGYREDVEALFRTFPSEDYNGMIVQTDIPFVSLCEHHLVPITGYAHVGYFPNGHVIGLSKIPRIVNAYARRLQIQERLTGQIAEALDYHLEPRGVMVVMEAEHMCMTIRGVQAPGTKTLTSAVRGLFNTNLEGEKDEFFRLIKR